MNDNSSAKEVSAPENDIVPEGNIDHTYRDYSNVPAGSSPYEGEAEKGISSTIKVKKPRGTDSNFPAKLHQILSRPELSHIITWNPHGRSWKVLQPETFVDKVAPSYFSQTKYSSFTRQVSGWGFRRQTAGRDKNSYYHELFLWDRSHLTKFMRRPLSTGKLLPDPKSEPDFYDISPRLPVPHNLTWSPQQLPPQQPSSSNIAEGGCLGSSFIPPVYFKPCPDIASHKMEDHQHQPAFPRAQKHQFNSNPLSSVDRLRGNVVDIQNQNQIFGCPSTFSEEKRHQQCPTQQASSTSSQPVNHLGYSKNDNQNFTAPSFFSWDPRQQQLQPDKAAPTPKMLSLDKSNKPKGAVLPLRDAHEQWDKKKKRLHPQQSFYNSPRDCKDNFMSSQEQNNSDDFPHQNAFMKQHQQEGYVSAGEAKRPRFHDAIVATTQNCGHFDGRGQSDLDYEPDIIFPYCSGYKPRVYAETSESTDSGKMDGSAIISLKREHMGDKKTSSTSCPQSFVDHRLTSFQRPSGRAGSAQNSQPTTFELTPNPNNIKRIKIPTESFKTQEMSRSDADKIFSPVSQSQVSSLIAPSNFDVEGQCNEENNWDELFLDELE